MFATRMMMAAGAPLIDVTNTDHASDGTNASLYTFSGKALGAEATDRKIVVMIMATAPSGDMSAVTVGGVSASSLGYALGGTYYAGAWIADVPTGTTGDIVITVGSSIVRCDISVYRLTNSDGTIPASGSGTDTSSPYTGSINVPARGAAFGVTYDNGNTTMTWTGIDEDVDAVGVDGETYSSAHKVFTAAQTGLAISATPAASGGGAGFFFSLGPA